MTPYISHFNIELRHAFTAPYPCLVTIILILLRNFLTSLIYFLTKNIIYTKSFGNPSFYIDKNSMASIYTILKHWIVFQTQNYLELGPCTEILNVIKPFMSQFRIIVNTQKDWCEFYECCN